MLLIEGDSSSTAISVDEKVKSPHQRAFMLLGAAVPLRIFFVSSPSGRCPAETANFLFLLVLSLHRPIMIGGLAEFELVL
ncbi:hypothetical protein [Escherichia coli]|uniref:hypothetical protein n=1 Tax=Escherichia coli TaxID=562 RepID=UPI00201A3666|nr:hypothetical protein [Escherichia coli]